MMDWALLILFIKKKIGVQIFFFDDLLINLFFYGSHNLDSEINYIPKKDQSCPIIALDKKFQVKNKLMTRSDNKAILRATKVVWTLFIIHRNCFSMDMEHKGSFYVIGLQSYQGWRPPFILTSLEKIRSDPKRKKIRKIIVIINK